MPAVYFLCVLCVGGLSKDKDRGLTQDMPLAKIKEVKIAAETAIPLGTYEIDIDTISPKYSLKPWYVKKLSWCKSAKAEIK